MSKSNILVIITDQQTAGAMSCTGNTWLRTPAMDALAARGTRFTRAYCSYPLCSPARGSQMTGRHPHQIGINANEGRFFWKYPIPDQDFLGHRLGRSGYRCVWAGKDMPPADGSREFELLCPWGDAQAAERTADFLAEPGDRPFLAVVNFVNPHNICEYARGAPLPEGPIGEEPALADLPPLPANHAVPPYEPEIVRVMQAQGINVYAGRRFDHDWWRRYLWAYYRLVEKVDSEVGRVLEALDASGRREDTLVWFCSDHGDGCAAHAWNQKQITYEEILRVPTIVAGPGLRAGAEDDRLVAASLDLFPTCCEAAGVPVPAEVEGRSLLPLARGEEVPDWRKEVVTETALNPERGNDRPARNRGRALITGRWKYSAWRWGRYREQLVDLQEDPGEMVNLAVCRPYAERLAEMRRRLHAWCEATGDEFEVPGYEVGSPELGWQELEAIAARPDH